MNYNKDLTKCTCIDDKNRPNEIKISNWVVKDREYHVIATAKNPITNQLMFKLAEIDTGCPEYWGYRSDRFSFNEEDIHTLFEVQEEVDLSELEMEELITIKN